MQNGIGDAGGNATANELGVYTLLGWTYSCIPDAAYPFPMDLVNLVRSTFDPDFLLLWCRAEYATPNKGRVRVGYYALARHVRNPHHDPTDRVVMKGKFQTGLLLPTTSPERSMYKTPILVARVLDGLTQAQRDTQKHLPHYEPFDMGIVNGMKWAKWVREHYTPEEVTAALVEADAARNETSWDQVKANTNYRRRHDKDHRQYQGGKRISMEGMEATS
jgi:hypothetical protein